MPISKANLKRYPQNWKTEIRPAILKRADNKCEFCGVKNYSIGFRDAEGNFVNLSELGPMQKIIDEKTVIIDAEMNRLNHMIFHRQRGEKIIRIVLTIAHLKDMRPEACDYENLAALCQRCHNKHDAKFRAENRKKNESMSRHKKG